MCSLHSGVRQAAPGRCPACGMGLVPEGARFGLWRQVIGPAHLILMAVSLAFLALTMMR